MSNVLIVICSYNSKEYTRKLYNDICSSEDLVDILILDNSSVTEQIPDFGNVHYMGPENVNFGGMHDWILRSEYLDEYEFIGIFNNDTFGFSSEHFEYLSDFLDYNKHGIVSFSISDEYDKSANIMWTKSDSEVRESNFIENVCPFYNTKLLKILKQYSPIDSYAMIDKIMSNMSITGGYKNIIIDKFNFHHIRSGVRKQVGNFHTYLREHSSTMNAWKNRSPGILKYIN